MTFGSSVNSLMVTASKWGGPGYPRPSWVRLPSSRTRAKVGCLRCAAGFAIAVWLLGGVAGRETCATGAEGKKAGREARPTGLGTIMTATTATAAASPQPQPHTGH